MYNYEIVVEGSGGEFCFGGISSKSGDFWKTQTKASFLAHLSGTQAHIEQLVEPGVALPKWHENDSFAHEYGIEHIERISVFESEAGAKLIADSKQFGWAATIDSIEVDVSESFETHTGYVLFTRSFEKGCCVIDLSIENQFDSSKLSMCQVELWGHSLIVGFNYAGAKLYFEETFGQAYADHDCLLKMPDGTLWFAEQ
jgi:hypothetical protein